MMIALPQVLGPDELSRARKLLADAPWQNGQHSAGVQAVGVKHNTQLAHDCPIANELGAMVRQALDRQSRFFSATLPLRLYTPGFNRYQQAACSQHGLDESYGKHVDNAIRFAPDTGLRVRADLSCTLFLSPPEDYDGGELVIYEPHGDQHVKLDAGSLFVYPATSVHEVKPVMRGTRLACFFWIQSMVRDPTQRRLLFEMDQALTMLRTANGHDPVESDAVVALTGTYHQLLRLWAET
jgi:PKHD-type hydroxylase